MNSPDMEMYAAISQRLIRGLHIILTVGAGDVMILLIIKAERVEEIVPVERFKRHFLVIVFFLRRRIN